MKSFASRRLYATVLVLSVVLPVTKGSCATPPAPIPTKADLAARYTQMIAARKTAKQPQHNQPGLVSEVQLDMELQPTSALLPLLTHPSGEIRQSAAEVILHRPKAEVATVQVRQSTTQALASETQNDVLSDLFDLAIISKSTAAIPSIGQILLAPQRPEPIRLKAAQTLGALHNSAAVQPLQQAIGDKNPRISNASLTALIANGDRSALPFLRTLAGDSHNPNRLAAIAALGTLKDTQSIPTLQKLLVASDKVLLKTAITALGAMHVQSTVPVLSPLLNYPDKSVQGSAFQAVVQTGGVEALRVFLSRYSTKADDAFALQGITLLYDVQDKLPKANIESDLPYLAETLTPLLPSESTLPTDHIIRPQHITKVHRLDQWYFVWTNYGSEGQEFLVQHQGANWVKALLIGSWIS